jgi:penicillin-binding protein 1A
MHPRMVAGAWVGFNDSRVTMRSDHWGQGGHNAILLVGDFFRSTLKSKLIDTKAKFPQPKRPPPLIVKAPEDELESVPSGYGIVTRSGSDTAVVVGPDGTREVERSRRHASPSDELGRFLSGLGRDPATGMRTEGSGDSGAQGGGLSGGGDVFPR